MKKPTVRIGLPMTKAQLKCLGAVLMAISSLIAHYTSCQPPQRSYGAVHIETYFTPQDPCIDIIVSKIQYAQKLILVQAYVITSQRIANALIQAHHKKIKVKLLVDKNAQTSKGSKIDVLLKHGIPIIIDKTFGLAHNKIMIIDDTYVITGSFNWTDSAQTKNSENVVIITGEESNRQFKNNWHKRARAGESLQLAPNMQVKPPIVLSHSKYFARKLGK